MISNEQQKNVYVQPDFKIFQVQLQQVIASSTEELNEENGPFRD